MDVCDICNLVDESGRLRGLREETYHRRKNFGLKLEGSGRHSKGRWVGVPDRGGGYQDTGKRLSMDRLEMAGRGWEYINGADPLLLLGL